MSTPAKRKLIAILKVLNEKRGNARIAALVSMFLRVYEIIIPDQFKSLKIESFDKVLRTHYTGGTGTWIFIRVTPMYLTAKLIHTLYGEEHEEFFLWVYAETIYVSLHLVTHVAFTLLQDFDLYQLLTVESLIIYAYCVLRVVSIVVIDTYFKYISSRRLREAFGGQGREYWELLSQWHRQRHEDQQKAQPESKEQVPPSGT